MDQLKLIRHNMGGINLPDDPAFGPWRLDAAFSVPKFMEVAAAMIYGSERITIRGKTKEALEEFVQKNDLHKHPRRIKLEITQPELGKPAKPPEIPKIPESKENFPKKNLGQEFPCTCNNNLQKFDGSDDYYGYPKPRKTFKR